MDQCPKGHPYDQANTYRRANGSPVCRACRREGKRAPDARKRVNGEGTISSKPRADGLWVARYTVVDAGRRRRPVLYGRTRAEVAAKLREALRARDSGQRVTPVREALAVYLAKWHEGTRPQLRPRSWERQGDHVRLHLVPLLGRCTLRRLSPDDVQRAYADLLRQGLAPATVRRVHATLHRALGQAVRWQLLATNVADLVDAPRVPHREMTALTPKQARELLEAAHGDRFEALFDLAVTGGLRFGELLALRWDDVDLEHGWLQVRGSLVRVPGEQHSRLTIQEPKTTRSRRRVELAGAAVDALQRHKLAQLEERVAAANVWRDRGLVFTGPTGNYLQPRTVQKAFFALLERAQLPRIRFHDLRHTAATLMLGRGVHPKVAADMLGHSTVAITLDLYSHVTPAMQREAVAAMDAIFAAP